MKAIGSDSPGKSPALKLPSGLSIEDPLGRLKRFSREEYDYYDGIADLEPNRIVPIDVLATWSVNSGIYRINDNAKIKDPARKLRDVHRGLARACDPILSRVAPDAELLTFNAGSEVLRELFRRALAVNGVGVAVATKVLHRKRRNLIPMLDNVLMDHYLTRIEAASRREQRNWGDTEREMSLAMKTLYRFREDLGGCRREIETIRLALADSNFSLSQVRALEILVWTELRGTYGG
jgi:hypothetical protein